MRRAPWACRRCWGPSRRARRPICASGRSKTWRSWATGSDFLGPSDEFTAGTMRNALAAIVAIVCWVGLAVQFESTFEHQHAVLQSIWAMARFFTVTTNFLVAIVMTALATGRRCSSLILGGLTLAILLVAVVYATLLGGLHPHRGSGMIANILLHDASPALMALWWLIFAPRGRLSWSAPWI